MLMYFRDDENRAVPLIIVAEDVAEPDQDTRDIRILLTGRKVVTWFRKLPGTNI